LQTTPLTSGAVAPEDIIKIMLATDNHIGYLERDPVRGQDAINTFEEILQLAVKHEVRNLRPRNVPRDIPITE
jgi:double-strand break repair protein MRE11